jgi:hypothetical protein
MKILLLLTAFTLPFKGHSMNLKERVEIELNHFEKKLGTGSTQQQAYNLLKTGGRSLVFRIQTYGRLFKDDYKFFKHLKNDFKELEDVLGQVQKWEELLEQKNLPEEKIALYTAHSNEEKVNLEIVLTRFAQEDLIQHYHKKISHLSLDNQETSELAIINIQKEIDELSQKEFDFTYGETGLHELRRSFRWPLMELDLFKEFFSMKATACSDSANDLLNIGLKSKYISLKTNPAAIMEVNYCVYIKMVGAVDVLGDIKDNLERLDLLNEEVDPKTKAKANSLYHELVPTQVNKLMVH